MLPPLVIKIFAKDQFSGVFGGIGSDINKTGKKIQGMGKKMMVGLTLPLGLAGVASIGLSNDLNASMANIGTLIPGNKKRLVELRKEVQKLAIETGKSTDDIAQGLFQTISAFGDKGSETLIKLRANARGAVAGVASVGDAINLTSLVTKAYGDTTADTTQKVLDLAFKANELGQTTFPEMAASLGKAVPFSKTLGVSMEELFGVMGTFTGVTGNTSEVTTQLTGFLGAMLKPTDKMSQAFKILGVRSGEELIKTKGLHGAMKELVRITKPYPGILGKVLGRKEALNLVLAATGAQSQKFTEKTGKMIKAMGAAEIAFDQQANGINKSGFELKQMTVKMSVAGQKMGDILGTALMPLVNGIGSLTDSFSELSPSTLKVIGVLGAFLAILPPIIFLVGSLAVAVNAAGWPLLLIVAAITAIIAAITILVIKWKEIMGWFRKMPVPIAILLGPLGMLGKAVQIITDKWDALTETFKSAWNWIKKLGNIIPAVFTGNNKAFEDFSKAGERVGRAWGGLELGDELLGRAGRDKNLLGPGLGPGVFNQMTAGPQRKDAKVKIDFANLPPGALIRTDDTDNILDIDRGLMTAGM